MKQAPEKPPKVQVRIALTTDAGRIAVLSGQLGYPCPARNLRRRLRNLLADRNHAIWVAETDGGTVAGWIHVFVKQLLESDREAEIGGLVIDEEFRSQGVGKALVECAEKWARSRRLKSVCVRSNIVRKGAHAFYLKQGYKIIKTQNAFRKAV
jgi:ribosomal protein S18 acetylase RimI-like enzyme